MGALAPIPPIQDMAAPQMEAQHGQTTLAVKAGDKPASLPITITNLRKNYGSFAALDNVSLAINSGEFITLLGPSGSGKTTLLMVLAGFVRPDSGSVRFGDKEVVLLPPHKRDIGMVFQNYALFPHMTVGGNLAYPLKLRGVGKAEIADRVKKALDLVHLGGYGDRKIDQLSGGQRQRVALARAVIFEPRILLMDEPLSALDKNLREAMQLEIRRLHDRLGLTTVYVTHDQREALTMSDRIAVINRGQVVQLDGPKDLYERPRTQFVANFIGESHSLPVEVRGNEVNFNGTTIRLAQELNSNATKQMLVLRPEKLHFIPGEPSALDNVITGTVNQSVFQGDSIVTYVQVAGDHEIAVRQPHRTNVLVPGNGETVKIGLAVEDTIVVPLDQDVAKAGGK
jgi:putative spermidine/putrescine transport system ATP-binding protein